MKPEEIASFASKWKFDAEKCSRSLYCISEVDNPRPDGRTHCLEARGAGKKLAIWMDEVMANWVDLVALKAGSLPLPHRIDACFVHGEDVFLIEFKADGNWKELKDVLWAKFHDTYVQLITRNILTFDEARKHLYYLVVTSSSILYSSDDLQKTLSEGKKAQIMLKINNPMEDYMQRPWKHPEIEPKADLRTLTAFSCRGTYTLNVQQFDRFVREASWI